MPGSPSPPAAASCSRSCSPARSSPPPRTAPTRSSCRSTGPMSRSLHRRPAEPAGLPAGAPSLAVVGLAALAVLVTSADTYVVVLALPDILTGIGVGLDQ